MWSGHSNITQECRASVLNVFVSRRDMSVGADHCGNPAVQMVSHHLFVAGGFRMKIHKSNRHIVGQVLQDLINCVKRAIRWLHENASDQVDDGDLDSGFRHNHRMSLAWSLRRKIGRSQDIGFGFESIDNIPFPKYMVAKSDAIDTGFLELSVD